jgi:hypothetical protein
MLRKLVNMNTTFILVNILISILWALLNSSDLVVSLKDKLSLLLLIESALMLLFGGLSTFSNTIFVNKVREYIYRSKEKWNVERSLENIKKNDVYILEGILLIIESFILGYLFE